MRLHRLRAGPTPRARQFILVACALSCLSLILCLLDRPEPAELFVEDLKDEPLQRSQPLTIEGVLELTRRRVPLQDVALIEYELVLGKADEGFEWRVISDRDSGYARAFIQGSSFSSLCKGLADLYEHYCKVNLLSWADSSRPKQACLRVSNSRKESSGWIPSRFPLRYAWNVVTFSYSSVHWDWPRYERELDWLALRGVNTLLALEGQERIIQKALDQLKIEVGNFFTHQTYFAWNRMGNIQSLGGPPAQAYLDARLSLQHKILKRMRELGIKPILPGFNGFVPDATPHCQIDFKLWSGFTPKVSSLCRPRDPQVLAMFTRAFVKAQLIEYRNYLDPAEPVLFSVDTFNENPVTQNSERDVENLAKSLVAAHQGASKEAGFPRAKLVMQMWFFANDFFYWTPSRARQFLSYFPRKSLILLDLHAEKRSQVIRLGLDKAWSDRTGHQLVFCVLHNFGGGGGIAGEVEQTLAKVNEHAQEFHGVGFAPEGLEQNEIVYDSILAMNWREFKLETWLSARYRSEALGRQLEFSWQLVLDSAYSRPERLSGFGPTKSVWEIRPVPGMMVRGRFMPTLIHYYPQTFAKVLNGKWIDLLADSNPSSALTYDSIVFARQALSDTAWLLAIGLQRAHYDDDDKKFGELKSQMVRLFDLLESLLGFRKTGFCYEDASNIAKEEILLHKQLLTVWHADNDGALADYGSQQLGGSLLKSVHRKRWEHLLKGKHTFGTSSYALERTYRQIEAVWFESLDEGSDCVEMTSIQQLCDIISEIKAFCLDGARGTGPPRFEFEDDEKANAYGEAGTTTNLDEDDTQMNEQLA